MSEIIYEVTRVPSTLKLGGISHTEIYDDEGRWLGVKVERHTYPHSKTVYRRPEWLVGKHGETQPNHPAFATESELIADVTASPITDVVQAESCWDSEMPMPESRPEHLSPKRVHVEGPLEVNRNYPEIALAEIDETDAEWVTWTTSYGRSTFNRVLARQLLSFA